MNDVNKRLLILPLIGSIISIIGLFILAWYSTTSYEENLWMVGIIQHFPSGGSVFDFLPAELFIPGFISAIVILISSIIIVINTLFLTRGKKFLANPEKLWILMGILELCVAVIYIIVMDIGFNTYTQRTDYPEYDFWAIYNIQFGIITPFIGAILSIVGAIAIKITNRE